MKKTAFLFLLLGMVAMGFAQPKVSNLSFPSSAKLLGLYEISFNLGPYENPFDPEIINVYAEFFSPDDNSFIVNGFYYEDFSFSNPEGYEVAKANPEKNGWRIRFTPNQVGAWRFVIHAIDKTGETKLLQIGSNSFSFNCHAVDAAKGFIRQANSMYLKQEVVVGGKQQYQPFFPIGPNVAWYTYVTNTPSKPFGIYDYEMYIDSLAGKANYMRVWISRYQYLSLYGPDYVEKVNGKPTMYFEKINQKDAAELDNIVSYAAQNDISIMLCFFTYGDFKHHTDKNYKQISDWENNPFNTVLKLKSPWMFFTDAEAKRITKNLIRYIVARWGYATNIVNWEFWNEVTNMYEDSYPLTQYQHGVVDWHKEMASYLRSIDPHKHLISTSLGGTKNMDYLSENIFKPLDFVQVHNYQNIHKAKSKEQFSYVLYKLALKEHASFPTKPFFVGEFGFGQEKPTDSYADFDPNGIDIHNSLWSSLFSGSMGPASFWYWNIIKSCHWFDIYQPMLTFCKGLPQLSDSFTAHTTGKETKYALVFPNNLETYYMANASEDTIYGWSQDTAFCYQSLRHLSCKSVTKGHFDPSQKTDPQSYVFTLRTDKRPKPSSRSNTITLPISKQPVGTEYIVRWYDAETGKEICPEKTKAIVKKSFLGQDKYLQFDFPSSIRDLNNKRINNTFGDAVFAIFKADNDTKADNDIKNGSSTPSATPKKLKIKLPK